MSRAKVVPISPVNFVGLETDQNLRKVCWSQRFLENEAKRHKLKHCEAIIYRNVARNRIRIIASFYGIPVLLLPPVDPASKVSLYIRINEFLRQFHLDPQLQQHVQDEISFAKQRWTRIQKRKKLAMNAKRKRSFL